MEAKASRTTLDSFNLESRYLRRDTKLQLGTEIRAGLIVELSTAAF